GWGLTPGGEAGGSVANYEPFRRLADVEFRVYDGMPHNICDALPDRCAADLREFLRRPFGYASRSRMAAAVANSRASSATKPAACSPSGRPSAASSGSERAGM